MDCSRSYAPLPEFRQGLYACFSRGADVVMNAADALLTETSAQSFAELSLSVCFTRRWPSLYQGFQLAVCDREALRRHFVQFAPIGDPVGDTREGPRGGGHAGGGHAGGGHAGGGHAGGGHGGEVDGCRCWLGIDASSIYRPYAVTAPDRSAQYVHNLPGAKSGARAPVKPGWSFSTLVVLPQTPSSWTYTLDNTRIPTDKTATEVALEQLTVILPLLNARLPEGERPRLMGDRLYPTADFLRGLSAMEVDGLFRIQGHRVLYGPPPPRKDGPGRPRLDGDRFQGKDPTTHPTPVASFSGHDEKGRPFSVAAWSDLHFQKCRDVPLWVFEVTRPQAKDTKRDPRVSWFVGLGKPLPPDEVPRAYARRFSQEHGYKFDKGPLLWHKPCLRLPQQFQLWTDLVASVHNTIFLARPLALDSRRPWELPSQSAPPAASRPATPQQVRRGLARIMPELGTPARPCQPRGNAPGRPRGTVVPPAPRFPVVKVARTAKSSTAPPAISRVKPAPSPPPIPPPPTWSPPAWLLQQLRVAATLV